MDTLTLFALLVVGLTDAPAYKTRQVAQDWLCRYGAFCPAALRAGQSQGTLETRRRCEFAAKVSRERHVDWLLDACFKPHWGHYPWIDCWPEEVLFVLRPQAVKDAFGKVTSGSVAKGSTVFRVHEEATRQLLRGLLLDGWHREGEIRLILGHLMDGHRRWCQKNGHQVPD